MKASVLLVDDDSAAVESLVRALSVKINNADFHLSTSKSEGVAKFIKVSPLVAVVDLSLEGDGGIEGGFSLIKELRAIDPWTRLIVLTGHGNVELGVRALNLGAASFLEKPADISHLAALVQDGISIGEMRRAFEESPNKETRAHERLLIGNSDLIKKVREATLFAASSSQPILILGETGTGKGVCARVIHELSSRKDKNFVRYQPNYAGGDLVQSELFGHLKGAFTGAVDNKRGLIKEADGGTLFMDEIDELPLEVQVVLLDFLQEGRYRLVGSPKEEQGNVRLIAATNRPINEALSSGRMRKDFYHRLAHSTINLPPLRERAEDIVLIAEDSLKELNSRENLNVFEIGEQAVIKLKRYNWPGNVRELIAVIQNAAYKARYENRVVIEEGDIALLSDASSNPVAGDLHSQVESFKLKLINEAMTKHQGNQLQAAKELGIDRGMIRRMLADKRG